jgi:hypothetical protein
MQHKSAAPFNPTFTMSLACFQAPRPPAAKRARSLKQQETTMKKVMCIVAIGMSLLGSANLAMAQSVPDMGVVTGSEANTAAHFNGGDYTDGSR